MIKLNQMANRNESPKFVFAHLMIPHQPYVFGPTGDPIYDKLFVINDLRRGFHLELYQDQVEYANLRLKEIISKLTDTDDQPIIIIQSDHGIPGGDFNSELGLLGDQKKGGFYLSRFNNFKAYYFPEVGRSIEFEKSTAVNTFRVLFNLYFGYDYDLLEDKLYHAPPKDKQYQFTDVTEAVMKKYTP